MNNKIIVELVNEVRLYLNSSPNAADSAKGIMQCWLQKEDGDDLADELYIALNLLKKNGELDSFKIPGGETIWKKKQAETWPQGH